MVGFLLMGGGGLSCDPGFEIQQSHLEHCLPDHDWSDCSAACLKLLTAAVPAQQDGSEGNRASVAPVP